MHSSKVAPRSPTQTSFSIEWLEAALHEGVNEVDVARDKSLSWNPRGAYVCYERGTYFHCIVYDVVFLLTFYRDLRSAYRRHSRF